MTETTFAPLPVAGYTAQSQTKVSMVNSNKIVEELLLSNLDVLKTKYEIDQRWLSIARTHIEEGFMALNRAVFQPQRVTLPDDVKKALDDVQVNPND